MPFRSVGLKFRIVGSRMKIISGRGIEVNLGNDYVPAHVSVTNPSLYWENDYQAPLRAVAQDVCAEWGDTYPFVQVITSGLNPVKKATFCAVDPRSDKELLCKTKSILYSRIPKREVELLQRIIDHIHEQANNKAIPLERREFFRNFSLPDPVKMPECWRVLGWWNRKLYILWGLEKRMQDGRGTFMPSSDVLDEHENGKRRRLSDVLGFWGIVPTLKYTASKFCAPIVRTPQKATRSPDAVASSLAQGADGCARGVSSSVASTPPLEGSSGGGFASGGPINTGELRTESGTIVDRRSGCLKWLFAILFFILMALLFGWILRGCDDSGERVHVPPVVQNGDEDSGVKPPAPAEGQETGGAESNPGSPIEGSNEGASEKKGGGTNALPAGVSGQPECPPAETAPGTAPPECGSTNAPPGAVSDQPECPPAETAPGTAPPECGSTNAPPGAVSDQPTNPPEQKPRIKKQCPECGEELSENGKCPNTCTKCKMRHLDVNGKCPVCDRKIEEYMLLFKISEPKKLSESGDVANVSFSVIPQENLAGREFVIVDWIVNGNSAGVGGIKVFSPQGGLRYSRKYTIDAHVEVDGKRQKVLPYQWNMIDEPAWQIVRDGQMEDFYRFKLICSNSSSVEYSAKNWSVRYRKRDRYLDFLPTVKSDTEKSVLVKSKVDGYNTYYLEITSDVDATVRGRTIKDKRTDIFELMHGDSPLTLVRMKYDGALDKIFHCLARNNDGSMHNGTAFAISSKYLLTNYHVAVGSVEEQYGGSTSRVKGLLKLSNETHRPFYAKVVDADRGRDIALLRICDKNGDETSEKFDKFFTLASSQLVRSIREGVNSTARSVIAIGYPKGTAYNGKPAFTDGKAEMTKAIPVNGVNGNVENVGHFTNIEPGYSGGPLIDMETGFILGVNRAGLMPVSKGHKPLKLATSVTEIRKLFKKDLGMGE